MPPNASCLGHVINLGNVDLMGHITKIAVVKNVTAIWEYDPICENNRILRGSLDVIMVIRTLAIKVSLCSHPTNRLSYVFHRFKHLDSALSTSKALRSTVESLSH